jgi:hypothetical protein
MVTAVNCREIHFIEIAISENVRRNGPPDRSTITIFENCVYVLRHSPRHAFEMIAEQTAHTDMQKAQNKYDDRN